MLILIVPDDLVNAIGDEVEVMVGFSCREEEIGLSILVLQDDLSSIFIREDTENRVIGLVLHDHVLILNVVVFQPGGVIQVDQEHLRQEKLDNLTVTLHREDFFFSLLVLNLNQVQFILIIQQGSPPVSYLHFLDVVLALDLIDFLSTRNQHLISQPAIKFKSITQSGSKVIRAKRYACRFEGKIDVVDQLSFLFGGAAQ